MAMSLDLSLTPPRTSSDTEAPLIAPPADVPAHLRDMGKSLNDGILVAEILGIDALEARLCISRVWQLFDMVPAPCFTDDDLPILRDWIAPVVRGLEEGIGEDGRPSGEVGEALLHSEVVEADASGVLHIRARYATLKSLREDLRDFARMVHWAIEHDLWIQMEER